MKHIERRPVVIAVVACVAAVVLAIFLIFGWLRYSGLEAEYSKMKLEHASTTSAMSEMIANLKREIVRNEISLDELSEAYESEKNRNDEFAKQIDGITESVGILDKITKTDPELLQKYSKVYFLNEHYIPSELSEIPEEYLYDASRDMRFHTKALPELEDLMKEALEDGIELRIVSAYRSFSTQATLKSNYTMTYGTGANKFSADQGYSEHQLGTTIDLTTPELAANFTAFGSTEAYKWLLENAHENGFILSYPENNGYYEFEPWHWRYVGASLARELQRENLNFYDAEQRMLDQYIVSIFK